MKKKTKNTIRTDAELREICSVLLSRKRYSRALEFTLDEIQRSYTIMTHAQNNHAPRVTIVNIGDCLYLQFSDISPQHFLITEPKYCIEKDFAFIPYLNWYGSKELPKSFIDFFITELRINKWFLIPILLLTFLLMFLAADYELYDKVSELVLQAVTVFLSIYLIFTVTQNQVMSKDRSLFSQGIIQKFYYDDRNLAILAIVTIISSIISIIAAHLTQSINTGTMLMGPYVDIRHMALSFFSAVLITLMVDTFLSVVNYYFFRSKQILDRNVASDILDDEFKKYYRE